jgi:hypothetical protein
MCKRSVPPVPSSEVPPVQEAVLEARIKRNQMSSKGNNRGKNAKHNLKW